MFVTHENKFFMPFKKYIHNTKKMFKNQKFACTIVKKCS